MSSNSQVTPYAFYCFYTLNKTLTNSSKEKDQLSYESLKKKLFQNSNGKYKDILPSSNISLFVTWEKRHTTRAIPVLRKKSSSHNHHNDDNSEEDDELEDEDDDNNDDNDDYELRGCIGTFGKIPLAQGIKQYALHSALYDSRFSPIHKSELAQLKVKCSILHDFETFYKQNVNSREKINDWKIGTHGIELHFKYKQNQYSATFLPEVMVEQEWDHTKTFENLIYKALSSSRVSENFKSSKKFEIIEEIHSNPSLFFTKIIRYKSTIYECTYKQYMKLYNKL